ncbi:kinase binding protein CGI-121-domain-containing protein [Mrakia frigida]|uniref:EKC/KEOPS complex subunit CGI121/TPRKB n=1 Tax=Mrakia frigida TaxID=29902 RepID=UPI003FCC18F2
MESYTLPHMPEELSQIHICLFKNVSNAKAIKTSLIAASSMLGAEGDEEREKYDFCFVEGKTIVSRLHLLTGIHQALLAASRGTLATKTAHSEILFTLNPSNNISDSLRSFGLSPKTTSLVLVRITPPPSGDLYTSEWVEKKMRSILEGEVEVGELGEAVEWKVVEKLYKLPSGIGAKDRKSAEEMVVSGVAMKSVS